MNNYGLAALLFFACSAPPTPEQRPPGNLDTFRPISHPTPNDQRTGAGRPGAGYWQQQVDYQIEATLDPSQHRVTATAEVLYHNNSPDPLPFLWIHLEQNIHRPDSLARTSGIGEELRSPTAGFEIAFVRTTETALEIQEHDTVGRIELPRPILPGETFRFSIGWSFAISPDTNMRMGVDPDPPTGPTYELAQWVPAVAVYDDVHGWNNLPYLGPGEFYTNFGDFDVALTLPRDYLCGATGTLVNPDSVLAPQQRQRLQQALLSDETVPIRARSEVNDPQTRPPGDGPLTWQFHAEQVRTFAWAASPGFAWDAASISIGNERVLCQSLYSADAPALWDSSTRMLRHSVAFYSQLLPYPWPQMTNVRGPADGGMEYPMIVFCRLPAPEDLAYWYGDGTTFDDPVVLFEVLDHEVGHTWFPMLVNTDERRHAWMDEGFNTFLNTYSQRSYLGEEALWMQGQFFLDYEDPGNPGVIVDPVDQISRISNLTHLAYTRPARGLYLLREHILGPERFDRAFTDYVQTWAFHSPQPSDFFRLMEDVSGAELSWFWRGWFMENRKLDQAVTDVTWSEDRGEVSVTFENVGDMILPLIFRVQYANGTIEDRRLPVEAFYAGDEVRLRWPSPSPVEVLAIDPTEEFPDWDRSNNSWRHRR